MITMNPDQMSIVVLHDDITEHSVYQMIDIPCIAITTLHLAIISTDMRAHVEERPKSPLAEALVKLDARLGRDED